MSGYEPVDPGDDVWKGIEARISLPAQMGFLIRQELPRNIIPVFLTLLVMVLGWFTPLGPVLTFVGPMVAAVFLAWDNTDLIPARNLQPFGKRFKSLIKTLLFHLGFGLPFLIPVLNLLFLSFGPVALIAMVPPQLYDLDLDLAVTNNGGTLDLFAGTPPERPRLALRLVGPGRNTEGLGATVRLRVAGAPDWLGRMERSRSYASAGEATTVGAE